MLNSYSFPVASHSCDFDGSTETMYRAGPAANSDSTSFTYSMWVYENITPPAITYFVGAGENADNLAAFGPQTGDTIFVAEETGGAEVHQWRTVNDLAVAQWVHVVMSVDTTQAAEADRMKIYLDTVYAGFVNDVGPAVAQNLQSWHTADKGAGTWYQAVGARSDASAPGAWNSGSYARFFNGFIAELAFIDGQTLLPASFASGGKPLDLSSLNFGNNGYWLRFKTGNDMGHDSAGIGDFTLVNITKADQSTDHP